MTLAKYIRSLVCMGLLLGLFAQPKPASACSCAVTGLPDQEFKKFNAVFTGRVVRIVDEYMPVFSAFDSILRALGQPPYFWTKSGRFVGYRVSFRVNQSWKGITERTVAVDTGYGMGDCGYSFTVNNDYLVYASFPYGMPANYWVTSICSRSTEISAAAQDLKYLNTVPNLSLQSSLQNIRIIFSQIVLALALIFPTLMIFFYFMKRRI